MIDERAEIIGVDYGEHDFTNTPHVQIRIQSWSKYGVVSINSPMIGEFLANLRDIYTFLAERPSEKEFEILRSNDEYCRVLTFQPDEWIGEGKFILVPQIENVQIHHLAEAAKGSAEQSNFQCCVETFIHSGTETIQYSFTSGCGSKSSDNCQCD